MARNERNAVGFQNFLDALGSVLVGIQNLQANQDRDFAIEEVLLQIDDAIITLHLLLSESSGNDLQELVELLTTIRAGLSAEITDRHSAPSALDVAFSCHTDVPSGVGRPKLLVHEEQIRFLRSLHFTWRKIAWLLGISESTLRRRKANIIDDAAGTMAWSNVSGMKLRLNKLS